MPYPRKLVILRAITDALKTITPANGYVSDLSDYDPGDGVMSSRVFRGRAFFGENDPLPLVSVLEGNAMSDLVAEPPLNVSTSEYDWPLLIQGFVKDDKDNPTDPAYVLMADVRKCLALQTRRNSDNFGNTTILGLDAQTVVTKCMLGPGIVRPADDVSAVAYFWMSLVLRIVDYADRPYD
jgi:hypothetical protein